MRAATTLHFEDEAAWAADRVQVMWSPRLRDVNLMHRPHMIETIFTARQCDLNAVIKPAFYELVRSPLTSDTMKEDVKNGRLMMEDLAMIDSARCKFLRRWMALVGAHDRLNRFQHCENARFEASFPQTAISNASVAQKIRSYEDRARGELTTPHHSTKRNAVLTCISADAERLKQAHTKVVYESGMLERYLWDPVCGLQVLADAPWSNEGICDACVQVRKAVWQAERERLWAEMDDWFGV